MNSSRCSVSSSVSPRRFQRHQFFLPVACCVATDWTRTSFLQHSTRRLNDFRTERRLLASERRPAPRRVAPRHWVVDVDHDARVGGREAARDGLLVRLPGAGATRDADVVARDIKLGATRRPGAVEAHVLSTQQVLAVLDALGDGERDCGLVCKDRCLSRSEWARDVARGCVDVGRETRNLLMLGHEIPPGVMLGWSL